MSSGGRSVRRKEVVVAGIFPLLVVLAFRKHLSQFLASRRKATAKKKSNVFTPLNTPQLEAAQRDLYVPKADGSRELLVPDASGRIHRVLIRPTKASTYAAHRVQFSIPQPVAAPNTPRTPAKGGEQRNVAIRESGGQSNAAARKVAVNKEFLRQLTAIFKIIVPRANAKEVFLFGLHTCFLLLRTYLSLLVAKLDGVIVRDLVSANAKGFGLGLVYWWLLAIPSVYTNSMIRYLQQKLSIAFRTRLTRYVHDIYLSDKNNYYKMINLDTRIDSADQFITTDIARFCDTLSSLYSNVSKPTLDIILFNYQLGRSVGRWGSLGLFVSYICTAWVLRQVTPGFGKLAAVEAKLEGDFRAAHSRLITNAEEIAFYNGADVEKGYLTKAYLRLIKHVNSIYKIRIGYSMIEDMVIKYFWSAGGYMIIAIPVFFKRQINQAASALGDDAKLAIEKAQDNVASRTENYISNRRLLLSLADAGGRLMYSYKEMAELAGYTSRVYTLLSTLHELNVDHYQSFPKPAGIPSDETYYDLGHINGSVVEGSNLVEFEKVPIVAPAPGLARGGEELVKALSLEVQPGDHILITGANGTGKTACARVLAGLWPVFEGIVRKPNKTEIMYLPQRPYLSLGSLRDQIIYPFSYPQMQAMGKTDEDLQDILKHVHLAYLPDREGGFDTRKEWKDVLSGGEKQRMGIARLFFHQPRFCCLDECTSAVSTDVEGLMYQHAKDLGITLITISHRPSLMKYHHRLLHLTGENGGWEVKVVGTAEERMTFETEMETLQNKLKDVDSWKARLKEIETELAFQKS